MWLSFYIRQTTCSSVPSDASSLVDFPRIASPPPPLLLESYVGPAKYVTWHPLTFRKAWQPQASVSQRGRNSTWGQPCTWHGSHRPRAWKALWSWASVFRQSHPRDITWARCGLTWTALHHYRAAGPRQCFLTHPHRCVDLVPVLRPEVKIRLRRNTYRRCTGGSHT